MIVRPTEKKVKGESVKRSLRKKVKKGVDFLGAPWYNNQAPNVLV